MYMPTAIYIYINMHAYVYVFVCTILCDLFGAAWDQSWEALPMAISVLPYPDGSCAVDDRFESAVLGILLYTSMACPVGQPL